MYSIKKSQLGILSSNSSGHVKSVQREEPAYITPARLDARHLKSEISREYVLVRIGIASLTLASINTISLGISKLQSVYDAVSHTTIKLADGGTLTRSRPMCSSSSRLEIVCIDERQQAR